jgi:hypothetical protein
MARPRFTEEQIRQMVAYYRQFGTVGQALLSEGTVGYVPDDGSGSLVHALHGKRVAK